MIINKKEAVIGPFKNIYRKLPPCPKHWMVKLTTSVTRLDNLLDFGQLFKAFGNN